MINRILLSAGLAGVGCMSAWAQKNVQFEAEIKGGAGAYRVVESVSTEFGQVRLRVSARTERCQRYLTGPLVSAPTDLVHKRPTLNDFSDGRAFGLRVLIQAGESSKFTRRSQCAT
jgi:hypothetical protein